MPCALVNVTSVHTMHACIWAEIPRGLIPHPQIFERGGGGIMSNMSLFVPFCNAFFYYLGEILKNCLSIKLFISIILV